MYQVSELHSLRHDHVFQVSELHELVHSLRHGGVECPHGRVRHPHGLTLVTRPGHMVV